MTEEVPARTIPLSEELLSNIPESELRTFNPNKPPVGKPVPTGLLGLIGFAFSGKTVFCAELHVFINYVNQDKSIRAFPDPDSLEYLGDIERILQTNSYIEEEGQAQRLRTIPGKVNDVGMGITFPSKRIHLQVKDISGEHIRDFVRKKIRNPDLYFLTLGREAGDVVGPFAYLLYCRAYALTVDCSQKDWRSEHKDYVILLDKLLRAKHEAKLREPLMLIFTKTDTLSRDLQDETADELLHHMSDLEDYLRDRVSDLSCICTGLQWTGSGAKKRPSTIVIDDKPILNLDQRTKNELQKFVDWLSRVIEGFKPDK